MFDERSGGFNTVYQDEPILPRPDRAAPPDAYDSLEWYAGYDEGLNAAVTYQDGYCAGLADLSDDSRPKLPSWLDHVWKDGWNAGQMKIVGRLVRRVLGDAYRGHMLETNVYPDEDFATGDRTEGHTKRERIRRADVVVEVAQHIRRWGRKILPKTPDEVLKLYGEAMEGDGSFCQTRIVTVKQAKKNKADEAYKEIEEAAQEFAGRCGAKMGTTEFLRALDKAVNNVKEQRAHWNNPEVRMEEWGGRASSETYFDDLNFENGRYGQRLASLGQVWQYIEKKFPILMMRYRESQARRANRRRSK